MVANLDKIAKNLPKGRAYLSDQLLRAVTSISLNIAEGAGEYSLQEKKRFYRMAKRSATECAAINDILLNLELVEIEDHAICRNSLIEIVSILIKMAKRES